MFTLVPMGIAGNLADDPSWVLIEHMTPAEMGESQEALWGTPDASADVGPTNLTLVDGSRRGAEDAGCRGWAERTHDARTSGQAEVAVATADLRCREETGYARAHRDVDRELQQRFVQEHRDELDAWIAAVRERVSAPPGE